MSNVTIRRCPVCQTIRGHTEQLVSELRHERGIGIEVEDGSKGEFTIEVGERRINGWHGESLRDVSDLAAEIHGAKTVTVG